MANYTVDIQLALKAQAAEKKLKNIQSLVDKIDNRAASISDRFSKLLIPDKTFARIASKLRNIEGLQKRSLDIVDKRTKRLEQEGRLGTKANSTARQRAQRLQQETGLLAGLKKIEKARQDILETTRINSAQRLGDLRAQTREVEAQARLRNMMEQGAKVRASYRADAQRGALSSPIGGRVDIPGSPAAVRRNAPRSPIGGSVNIPGSPAARRAGRARAGKGAQSALLGVGFPLLFGGGAGSVIGGGLGSVGGFGGQIIGSAIGQQVDQAVGAIAKLGQALNPLTADLDAVVNAAGKSGTEFEKLIKELEEVAGAEAALKAASEQLATEIGQGGVDALKQFGEESAELGNTFAVTLSQISAAVAELINKTGFLRGVIDNLARDNDLRAGIANTSDPQLQRLKAARQSFIKEKGGVFYEEDMKPFEDQIILRQRQLAVEKELTAESRIRAGIQQAQAAKDADTVAILQAQVALKESGLDLTTQEGYNLAETVVLREFDKKEQELIAKGVSKEVRDLQRKLALLGLSVEVRRQENRQAEKFEREFQQNLKKRRQLQANLLAESNKQQEIENKIIEATEGRAAAIEKELADMQAAYAADAQRIILTTESRDLAQEKVNTLAKEYELKQLLLRQEYTELQLKKDLLAIQQKQTLSGIGTDLTRQIEDASLRPTGNAMQDQQLELRISQIRRQEDARRSLTDQIEKERAAILRYSEVGNASGVMDAQERVEGLQEQIALYDRLLPQLDAAEQSQLRFNQALEAAKPFADAFTSGLLDGMVAVVDGTKTAEQAFADFLRSIADMLFQAAKQMIAQYIAIGIAKMFAGMGSNTGLSDLNAPANINNPLGIMPRANGGPVTGNRPYLVGERGPELFVPGAQGNIVPNNAMGSANVTVNVDASGSSVEGDSEEAGQLGKLLGAAVQAELIKQKRPGGLLA